MKGLLTPPSFLSCSIKVSELSLKLHLFSVNPIICNSKYHLDNASSVSMAPSLLSMAPSLPLRPSLSLTHVRITTF